MNMIRQGEDLFRILEDMTDGHFVMDERCRITFFNPAAEKITGLPIEEALHKTCKDVFGNANCQSECPLRRGDFPQNNAYFQELVLTRQDGNRVPIMSNTAVIRDRQGQITGGIKIFRDISAQKALEDSLRESQRKLSTLISNLPGMAYRCLNDQNWTMEFISEGCFELTG